MTTALEMKNSWTWLVTDKAGAGLTLLNRLTSGVDIDYVIGAPIQATGSVPSDNPEINIPHTDGNPFLSYNDRLLYGLRREGIYGEVPYVCRFAGVIQINEDEASTNEPVTHWTAYDPWMWLNSLPVVTSGGDLLGKNGLSYTATRADIIAKELLDNCLSTVVLPNPANPVYIDVASGHYDACDAIDISFSQGISVGEAWTQLVDAGALDIVLTPIYDPHVRPGKLSVLNIYQLAGSVKNNAIFAWDKMPRSLTGIDRLLDGTQMINVAQYYYDGGKAATQETDAGSVAQYGPYWEQQSFPPPSDNIAVSLLAATRAALRKKGKMTITVDPDPDRGPDPFTDYYLGDRVPVYAGRQQAGGGYSFRAPLDPGTVSAGAWTNPQRVYGFQLSLENDEVETVRQLLLTDANA